MALGKSVEQISEGSPHQLAPAVTHDVNDPSKETESTDRNTPMASGDNENEQEKKYPPFVKVILILSSLYLAVFLVALDLTIVGTATPRISDEFHSLGDIGWYGSAYLLTTCSFQLLFGRIYTFYSPKMVFLAAVMLFEVGSAVCGAAPSSTAFIIGRAIAGIGSSGITGGAVVILMYTTPIDKRPVYMGFIGAVFGAASVVGPLIGGVLTSEANWRWCFYINLPIGAITIGVIILVLRLPSPQDAPKTIKEQLQRLDPLGTLAFLPGIVCLLLALQWGGSTYPWRDGRIIALLVIFGVCMAVFVAIQRWKGEDATVPPRIFFQRSILSGSYFYFFAQAALIIMLYYLPVWFQAVKGESAIKSGIMTIPNIVSLVIGNILGGIVVSRLGYYTPFMIASSIVMSIGAGLLSTFTTTTGHAEWIGYQFLFGFGMGLGIQQGGVAAQTVLQDKDVPTGVSVMFFFRNLGGAVFLSVAQNLFENKLIEDLQHIPGLNADAILSAGATGLRNVVDRNYLPEVLVVYNGALVNVYYCAVAVSCATIVGSLAMEWRSVKKVKEQRRNDMEKAKAKAKESAKTKGEDAV